MKQVFGLLLALAALCALPAARAGAAGPTLSYGRAPGYQITVSGSGWNPAATVTFSLLKGDIVQSIELRPDGDGTFEVGLNRVNICGLTGYTAKDTVGEQAVLHSPGVMCMQNYVPPPPGTAVLTVLRGQRVGASSGASLAPRALVQRYFADLGAHRYAQALNLESACALSFTPGADTGSMVTLASAANDRAGTLKFVRAARITAMSRLHAPVLDRATLAAFTVGGTFAFAPPAHGLTSGYHRFTVILRQCDGRWTVDPGWWQPLMYAWL